MAGNPPYLTGRGPRRGHAYQVQIPEIWESLSSFIEMSISPDNLGMVTVKELKQTFMVDRGLRGPISPRKGWMR